MVTPLGLISSKIPQIFSRGECRLTMTMELGSITVVVLCPFQDTARESNSGEQFRVMFPVVRRRSGSVPVAARESREAGEGPATLPQGAWPPERSNGSASRGGGILTLKIGAGPRLKRRHPARKRR